MKNKLPIYIAVVALGLGLLSYLFFGTLFRSNDSPGGISRPAIPGDPQEVEKDSPVGGSSGNAVPADSREHHESPSAEVEPGGRQDPGNAGSPPNLTVRELIKNLNTNERVEMTEGELNAVILHSLEEAFPGRSNQFVKNLESQINREKIVVGLVIDANYIPWEDIPPEYHYTREYVKQFAALSGGELDIRLSGKPYLKDNQLKFDKQSTIQIGFLEYSLNSLIARIDQNEDFNKRLFRRPLPFRDISLEEGMLILYK